MSNTSSLYGIYTASYGVESKINTRVISLLYQKRKELKRRRKQERQNRRKGRREGKK